MTGREEKFVIEYMHSIPRNQTAAAVRAGYSEKSANRIASRLMKKPEIQAVIKEEQKELRKQNTATVNEILELLTSIMRGEAVDCIEIQTENREKILVKSKPCVCDRLYAAELLGRYYGLFKNKRIYSGDNCGVIILPPAENT